MKIIIKYNPQDPDDANEYEKFKRIDELYGFAWDMMYNYLRACENDLERPENADLDPEGKVFEIFRKHLVNAIEDNGIDISRIH